MALIWLARWFDWRQALAVVQPATLIRWHQQGFRLFWRWKANLERPPIPVNLQALIRRMARDNPSWGEERIANELLLKLGPRVASDRAEIPIQAPRPRSASTRAVPMLADLCPQSCQGDCGL
jgi:putative transposase